jgi:hypothetical protein
MMNLKSREPGRRINKFSPFAPRDIIERMVHAEDLTEELWQEFIGTNPNNNDFCITICRAICARDKAWEELLKREPDKEDFFYLFEHLRNKQFISYYVWDIFRKREDLTRSDVVKALGSKKISHIAIREGKIMIQNLPEEKINLEEQEKKPTSEKNGLAQSQNSFVVNRKKRLNKPWERDYRNPMCG